MKRFMKILALCLSFLLLVSCVNDGGSDMDKNDDKNPTETVKKPDPVLTPVNEVYDIKQFAYRESENGMPYRMKLTVYGACDETYRKTCGSADGFTRVSKAIDLLKSAGVPLILTSTIVKENADDLQKIYAFAREKGLPMQHTISVVNSSRDSINSITSSRFALSDFPEELTLEELEKTKIPPLKSPFAWCASYRTSLWITWNGHLQLCAFMNKPFTSWSGNLKNDYWALHEKLERIKSPAECSDCKWKEFCQRCPGTLCAESSDPEKISESLCDMAKKLHEIYTRKKEN